MPTVTAAATPMGTVFYPEKFPNTSLRRIFGGIAWPARGRPGFLVVVGEDLHMDFAFGARHYRRLLEAGTFEGGSFLSLETLLRAVVFYSRDCKVQRWCAPRLEHNQSLLQFNRSQAEASKPQVRTIQPSTDPDFEFYASLVRTRVFEKKTMHFGGGSIPAKLAALPTDCSNESFEDHPEATALFFAVAGLELLSGYLRGQGRSSAVMGVADRAGGY